MTKEVKIKSTSLSFHCPSYSICVFFSEYRCCSGCPQKHSICRTFAGADWATCWGRARQPSATDNAGVLEKGRHAPLEAVGALNTLTLLRRLASTASTAAKKCLGDPLVKSLKPVSEDTHGKRTLRPWCRNNLFSEITVGSIWNLSRTYWLTTTESSFLGQSSQSFFVHNDPRSYMFGFVGRVVL